MAWDITFNEVAWALAFQMTAWASPVAWFTCSLLKASELRILARFIPSATLISASRLPNQKHKKTRNCVYQTMCPQPYACP